MTNVFFPFYLSLISTFGFIHLGDSCNIDTFKPQKSYFYGILIKNCAKTINGQDVQGYQVKINTKFPYDPNKACGADKIFFIDMTDFDYGGPNSKIGECDNADKELRDVIKFEKK